MQLALAIAAALGSTLLLVLLIGLLTRRVALLRMFAVPLFVGALVAGLEVFTLFPAADRHRAAIAEIALYAVAMLIAVLLIRLTAIYLFDFYLHTARGLRLPPLLTKAITGAAYIITGLIVLAVLDVPLSGIAATGAVTSLVLGLALQPILGNFFSGLVISLERPFRLNDWILYNDTEARVVNITWRTTHLRTRDNDNLVVPNGNIANSDILNFFYPHPMHMERLYVGIHYRTPPYRVREALLAAAAATEGVLEKPPSDVYLVSFDDSAINYELRIWLEDIARRPRIESDLRMQIWEELRVRDITIPFPIRTLEIEPLANTVVNVPLSADEASSARRAYSGVRLFVLQGRDTGVRLRLGDEPVTVGRSEEASLTLSDPRASKAHCRIEREQESFYLTDLGSTAGTRINEREVKEKVRLRDLDRINIGETVIIFEQDAV